jgi:hypothetical protein
LKADQMAACAVVNGARSFAFIRTSCGGINAAACAGNMEYSAIYRQIGRTAINDRRSRNDGEPGLREGAPRVRGALLRRARSSFRMRNSGAPVSSPSSSAMS